MGVIGCRVLGSIIGIILCRSHRVNIRVIRFYFNIYAIMENQDQSRKHVCEQRNLLACHVVASIRCGGGEGGEGGRGPKVHPKIV